MSRKLGELLKHSRRGEHSRFEGGFRLWRDKALTSDICPV
jgi:hypothetical protein